MASFYSNVTNEGDILPATYLLSQKHAPYPSLELHNNKAYGQPSLPVSYLNLLSGNSILAHDHADAESIRSRDETLFVPPTGVPTGVQQFDRQLNFVTVSDGDAVVANSHVFSKELVHDPSSEQHSQYHGLCLSLGSQEPSLVQLSSDLNQYTTSSLCSFLGSNIAQSEDQLSQNNGLKNVEYLSFDLSGGTQNTVKYEVVNNFQNFTSSKETSSLPSLHQTPGFSGIICDSKYLKAAQDLLDEVVNVHRTLQQSEKGENNNSLGQDASKGTDASRDCFSSELHESTTNATPDLSPSERHSLQDKMTKLFSMLDEVDRRYKQYFHQMQIVVSSFDTVAGQGAAKPYSALALRTISRQFRSLRDAIKKQIEATQKILGEQDASTHGQGVLSRLRYVDQKLRQQKAVQQFGILRQPWRPQRGLPETAVSVLRAWLFEHFLHPYPKDSEKIVLARQAGLTRSQVANWFINARVRLWKPMIEDIYKEEFGDAETEPKSSPERAAATPEISVFGDREEEFQGSLMSAAADGNHWAHSNESRPDVFSSAKIDACREELGFEAGVYQENEVDCGLTDLQNKQILKVAKRSDGRQTDLIFDGTMRNQVSLALGLQHNEKDPQLISGGNQLKGNDTASSSMGLDKLEYYNVDTVNHQATFANPNLLSDFVAR